MHIYVPEEIKGTALAGQILQKPASSCLIPIMTVSPRWKIGCGKLSPSSRTSPITRLTAASDPAAVDICRFLLPAASLANVGVTINARALEYAICKTAQFPVG